MQQSAGCAGRLRYHAIAGSLCSDGVLGVLESIRSHQHRRRQRRPRLGAARRGIRCEDRRDRVRPAGRHLRQRRLRAQEGDVERRRHRLGSRRRGRLRLRCLRGRPRLGRPQTQARRVHRALERDLRAQSRGEGGHPHSGHGAVHRCTHRRGERRAVFRQAHGDRDRGLPHGTSPCRAPSSGSPPTAFSSSSAARSASRSSARATSPASWRARSRSWAARRSSSSARITCSLISTPCSESP